MTKPFQFLHIPILKEYLRRDLYVETPFGFDLERVVDDWVFLCFLVGNDFLPHLPTLKIFEGAIAMLMKFYKQLLPTFEGYITENGQVDLQRFEMIMLEIGAVEDEILRSRRIKEQVCDPHIIKSSEPFTDSQHKTDIHRNTTEDRKEKQDA